MLILTSTSVTGPSMLVCS